MKNISFTGFVGNKVEDLNRNDLFARLRVRFGLPRDFSILVGLTPPVERNGVTPTLIVLAVERPILESSGWRLGLRGYGQLGSIEGDFICPAVVSGRDDLEINPDQCHKASKDEVGLDYLGLELSASRRLGNERWEPYLSISANYLDLDFQIDARYSVFEDRNRLATSGVTYAARLGLEFATADRLEISGELFFSLLQIQRQPMGETEYDNLLNLRLLVGYGLF